MKLTAMADTAQGGHRCQQQAPWSLKAVRSPRVLVERLRRSRSRTPARWADVARSPSSSASPGRRCTRSTRAAGPLRRRDYMFERGSRPTRGRSSRPRRGGPAAAPPGHAPEHLPSGFSGSTRRAPHLRCFVRHGLRPGRPRAGHPAGLGHEELDAVALGAVGIDLDSVRDSVEAAFGPGALDGPGRVGPRGERPPAVQPPGEEGARSVPARGPRAEVQEHLRRGQRRFRHAPRGRKGWR